METKVLSLIAAIFGLVGSSILAYSLNRVLTEVNFCIKALSISIETVVANGDVYVFRGLDERLNKAECISNYWVRSGICCIVVSAAFAAASLYA